MLMHKIQTVISSVVAPLVDNLMPLVQTHQFGLEKPIVSDYPPKD